MATVFTDDAEWEKRVEAGRDGGAGRTLQMITPTHLSSCHARNVRLGQLLTKYRYVKMLYGSLSSLSTRSMMT